MPANWDTPTDPCYGCEAKNCNTCENNPYPLIFAAPESDFQLKDGGTRKEYDSGAMKEEISEGKGRYDLLPVVAIRRVAEVYRKGAEKYADRNWEKGLPFSRLLDSAKRHVDQFQEGLQDEDHLAQAVWNLLAIMHTQEMIKRGILPVSLNDLPDYTDSP